MNRFVKPKAPAFLKVFERTDEKDDRRLLEMSTNSFASFMPSASEGKSSKPANGDDRSDEDASDSEGDGGDEHIGVESVLPEAKVEAQGNLSKNPSSEPRNFDSPMGRQKSARALKDSGPTSPTKDSSRDRAQQSSVPTPVGTEKGLLRTLSDRRLAKTDGPLRDESEMSVGSEPSAYRSPPKPSLELKVPYPVSPQHRLSEAPVSIVKHAEATFVSPKKSSLFSRLRQKKDEPSTQVDQVEIAVAEVLGGADSLPFAQLTLEAVGSKSDNLASPSVAEEHEKRQEEEEGDKPRLSKTEPVKALKHPNRSREGKRLSTREVTRKKSGEIVSRRSKPSESGQKAGSENQGRRKSTNDENAKGVRRRRSESLPRPRRRSVSRTRVGKPEGKGATKKDTSGMTTSTDQHPVSPIRSSSPLGRMSSPSGESTMEWRRNPRAASLSPAVSKSPVHRNRPDRNELHSLGRDSINETTSHPHADKIVHPEPETTAEAVEEDPCQTMKRSFRAPRNSNDERSSGLLPETSHSSRGLLGNFLDQKRPVSEHSLPRALSDASRNSDDGTGEFAGDGPGYKDRQRIRNLSAPSLSRRDSSRQKPLLHFPLESEHTVFSTTLPSESRVTRDTSSGGSAGIDIVDGVSGKDSHRVQATSLFQSSILHSSDAAESGEAEHENAKISNRRIISRRTRRRSVSTPLEAQPSTPKRLPRRSTVTGVVPASSGRIRRNLNPGRSEHRLVAGSATSPVSMDEDPDNHVKHSPRKTPSSIPEEESDSSDSTASEANQTSPSADVSRDEPAPVSYKFSEVPFLMISTDITEKAERSLSELCFAEAGARKVRVDCADATGESSSHHDVFIVGKKNGVHDDRTSDEYTRLSFELAQSRIRLRQARMEVDQIELDILMLQERLLVLAERHDAIIVELRA